MAERILYIGGFGNGKKSVERVVSAIVDAHGEDGLVDADGLTFSQGMENPEILRQIFATPDVDVQAWGHSGAHLAITRAVGDGTSAKPVSIEAIAPPIPTPMTSLAGYRTLAKTWDMHTQDGDEAAIRAYDLSSAAEFISHPVANLKWLPAISRFDAIHSAVTAQQQGIPTTLAFMNRDRYFSPTSKQLETATNLGVRVLSLVGMHDQVVLHPDEIIPEYLREKSRN